MVKVNDATDKGTALEYLHRRAGELCPAGYQLLDRESDNITSLHMNGDMLHATNRSELTALIQCGRAERAAPSAPAEPTARYYCASAPGDSSIAECAATPAGCADSQRRIAELGGDATACTEAATAVCVAYLRDGRRKGRCAPTLGSCERLRGGLAATVAVSACTNVAAGAGMREISIGNAPVPPVAR